MNEPVTEEMVTNAVEGVGAAEQVHANRIRVRTAPDDVREAIRRVQQVLLCDRLISISTVDTSTAIELTLPPDRAAPHDRYRHRRAAPRGAGDRDRF